MTYRICFKFDEGDSGDIGWIFMTYEEATETLSAIKKDPTQFGLVPELRTASLWITDEKGNLI